MALTWKIDKVKNWKEISEGNAWTVTDMLIWATMIIGLPQITEANADEFYNRLHFVEHLHGTLLRDGDGGAVYISKSDVERRIGLSTNVTTLTRPQFVKRQADQFFRTNLTEEHK